MTQSELWDRMWTETKAVLAVAGGLTGGLWIKRVVERLVGHNLIDPEVVEHGLNRSPSAMEQPSPPMWADRTPPSEWDPVRRPTSWTNGSAERQSGGEVLVDTWDRSIRVWYSGKYETRDGFTLYTHDQELNPHHECGPCPLLKAKTPCRDCEWCVDGGYVNETRCAAIEKLENCPEDFSTSIAEVKHMLEHA